MPASEAASVPEDEPHRQRQAAQAFGSDPELYDRARARYPDGLIEREEWLDALQTSGGAVLQSELADLLDGVGDAIDAAGGRFTMDYLTFVVTAVRAPR